MASDFEIAQMEKQLADSRAFDAQVSARLNLGDARGARNETSLARAEYEKAISLAEEERAKARIASNLARYANATAFAALGHARLHHDAQTFALLEESIRYASDDADIWNLYTSAMINLDKPRKAVSAARTAVAVAAGSSSKLEVAVYEHALANALMAADQKSEAESILLRLTGKLRSADFAELKKQAARQEAFEINNVARGDVAAYVALLNRTQVKLGMLYEERGDLENARVQYGRVLDARGDDVTALSAMARLARSDEERERLYAAAFEANPFSLPLIREYQQELEKHPARGGSGTQLALQQLARGETRAARATLDALLERFPANDTLRELRREAEMDDEVLLPSDEPDGAELRALLESFERLTPEQLADLDRTTFTSVARFEGSVFESGTIDGVPFRFGQAVTFAGSFDVHAPLRLSYRILGVTRSGDADALLLEPVRVESVR